MNMDQCRICMSIKKCNILLNHTYRNKSYTDLITSVSGVKISDSDNITKKICKPCSVSLLAAYKLINQIKRSEIELLRAKNINKIIFDNITDIETQIKVVNVEFEVPHLANVKSEHLNMDEETVINDTVIKRIKIYKNSPKKQLDLMQFLKSIDKDDYDVDDMDYSVSVFNGSDDDYDDEEDKPKKKKAPKKTTKLKSRNKENLICIKPVMLKDYVIDFKDENRNCIKKKPPKPWKKRFEMCPQCGKMTRSLNSHILIHIDRFDFKCDECGKYTRSLARLKAHKLTHTLERNIKCHLCVSAFTTTTALKTHMLSHSQERNFICDVCKKGYKRKSALLRHVRIHNMTNKCIKCELCNMSFYHKHGLKHHMRVHTGERPYKCEICAQPYSYKHDFNRHCLNKHGIFLKRRQVNVMNEEVLKREKLVLRNLVMRINGQIDDAKPLNPFEGEAYAAQALAMVLKALRNNCIPIDFDL